MSDGKLHGNVTSAATTSLAIGKSGVAVERIDQELGKEVWCGD